MCKEEIQRRINKLKEEPGFKKITRVELNKGGVLKIYYMVTKKFAKENGLDYTAMVYMHDPKYGKMIYASTQEDDSYVYGLDY